MCTVIQTAIIAEAIWLALSNAIPQWITPGHARVNCYFYTGFNPRTKRRYVCMDFLMAVQGSSGTEGYDGWDLGGPTCDLGAMRLPDIEIYELVYPIHVLQHEQEIDTAGAGKFRSGLGHIYNVRFLADCINGMLFGQGMRDFSVPFGLSGGKNPRPNKIIVHRADGGVEEPDIMDFLKTKAGDIMEAHNMGAAGFGDPFERDLEKVREDVEKELVSIEGAEKDYGVIIDPVTLEVDAKATDKLREEHNSSSVKSQ